MFLSTYGLKARSDWLFYRIKVAVTSYSWDTSPRRAKPVPEESV